MPLYDTVEWFEDGEPVTLPECFYSSQGIVDRMIDYLDEADPDRPFFGYLSFQAIHLPIQVPREYTERYNGRFDRGWEKMREERLQRAVSLGLVGPGDASQTPKRQDAEAAEVGVFMVALTPGAFHDRVNRGAVTA